MNANAIVSRTCDTIDETRNNNNNNNNNSKRCLDGSSSWERSRAAARHHNGGKIRNGNKVTVLDGCKPAAPLLPLSSVSLSLPMSAGTGSLCGSGSSRDYIITSCSRRIDQDFGSLSRSLQSESRATTRPEEADRIEPRVQDDRVTGGNGNSDDDDDDGILMDRSKPIIVIKSGASLLQQETASLNITTRMMDDQLRLPVARRATNSYLCRGSLISAHSILISVSIFMGLIVVASFVSAATNLEMAASSNDLLTNLGPDVLAAVEFTPTRKPHLSQQHHLHQPSGLLVPKTPVLAAAAATAPAAPTKPTTSLVERSGNMASGSSKSVTSISSGSANNSPISSSSGNGINSNKNAATTTNAAGQIISMQPTKNNSPIISSSNSQSASSHSNRRSDNHHHHHNHHQGSGSSGSSPSNQFTRANELDLFLDDMNHNELRAIASGKPIDDMFQARPVGATISQKQQQQQQQQKLSPNQEQEAGGGEHNGGVGRLDSSQSEQQIYSECALILQRTYVKNIDDPKHQLVPFGKTEQSCISYKDIDKAVILAKKRLKFLEITKLKKKSLKRNPLELLHTSLEPPEDLVAAIGELNMAITQIIANQFDLSNDEVLNGLPLINMAKTKFWPLCPALVRQDIKCELGRYRTITGHCNNLKHPTWGAAMTPFARYLPPVHPDGIWIPRKSVVTEITFHLSDGHHETHSNVLPSLTVPVYGERASSSGSGGIAARSGNTDAGARTSGGGGGGEELLHVERGEAAQSWRHLVRYDSRENLDMDQSAQLALHVRPNGQDDQQPLNDLKKTMPSLHNHRRSHSDPKHLRQFATTTLQQATGASAGAGAGGATPAASDGQLAVAASTFRNGRSMATELPSARLVTSIVHRDVDIPSHDFTILFMSWGQLLDHDMTRAAQPPSSIKCCTQDEKPKHKLCLPIQVPPNDPFYAKFNVQCLEFRRSLAGLRPNCVLGPRVHQNAITAPIDANFVYGSSQARAEALRLFKGGRLRDRDWFKREGLKPLLPAQEIEPDLDCLARPKDLFCFLAGDVRVNEQTHLTVLHTLYMREHNRLAERLEEINPHWDDERLYQETRHIMAAGVQHVMINEYLPLLIGKRMADLYNLTAHNPATHAHHSLEAGHSYWHGYDPSVTTSVSNSFAAAAFRQGHTFVQGQVERYNKFHEFVTSEQLRRLFKQPFLLYRPGVLDELTGGMINQPSQSYDPFISEDISGHLFQPPESKFGHDLPAINLQRGREQGLPGYNLFREWCGLPRAENFDQLEPYLTNHTAYHYSRLYKHVDDIDLWSGGVSERKLPGAAIGPTFACIIARQFSNTRRGDRYWYENPGLPSSFTPQQLIELRKITLAKILCTNSDDLPTIQRWALRMAHPVLNPRLPCHQLPEINLGPWQDHE